MAGFSLPHRAKGIDTEAFAMMFGIDKIIFVCKSGQEDKHYTLHAGLDSGVVDFHETETDALGRERYHTILPIHRDSIPAVINELADIVPAMLNLASPLAVGLAEAQKYRCRKRRDGGQRR